LQKATAITLVLSVGLHVGLASGLVAVAQKRELRRRAISVAVTGEKKKEAKPKPPPPPKPIARPAPPPKVAVVAKADVAPAPVHAAVAAPVVTNLAMSNEDVGPGIGLGGRAPAPAAAAPVKVASAISEKRVKRAQEEAGGGEEPCNEEPTKPEAVFKSELNYSLHPQAQADGVEGKFRARLTIDASGEVSNVEVQTSIEPAFDAALVAALKTWRFKPAMACGKPVAGGTFVVTRTFELGD
jgi:protein TonB